MAEATILADKRSDRNGASNLVQEACVTGVSTPMEQSHNCERSKSDLVIAPKRSCRRVSLSFARSSFNAQPEAPALSKPLNRLCRRLRLGVKRRVGIKLPQTAGSPQTREGAFSRPSSVVEIAGPRPKTDIKKPRENLAGCGDRVATELLPDAATCIADRLFVFLLSLQLFQEGLHFRFFIGTACAQLNRLGL